MASKGGKVETKTLKLTWSEGEGVTVHQAPGVRGSAQSRHGVLQLSWWEHEVTLGMLGRLLRRSTSIERYLHAELRIDGKHRVALRARVPDPGMLENIPRRRAPDATEIRYEDLASLLETAQSTGYELINPKPEIDSDPIVLMPEGTPHELSVGDSLEAVLASGATVIRLPPGTFEVGACAVDGELMLMGSGQDHTTIISTAEGGFGFEVTGRFGLRHIRLKDADVPNKGLIRVTGEGQLALEHSTLEGDPDDAGAKGIVLEDHAQLHMNTSELTGVYFALTVGDASQAVLENNRFEKSFVGIRMNGNSEAKILGNVCYDNTTGLSVKGNAVAIIDGNSFVFNQVSGLEIAGDAQAGVLRNLCEGNSRGIIVRTTQAFPLEHNRCYANSDVGIQLLSAAPLVARHNQCRWNQHGIEVTNPKCEAVFEQNICSNNTKAGIRIGVGAPITARGNTFRGNAIGIQVDHVIGGGGEGPTLEDNIVEDNTAEGILFEGAGKAKRNISRNNSVSIRVSTTSRVILADNQEN